jgi:hypothetical protein
MARNVSSQCEISGETSRVSTVSIEPGRSTTRGTIPQKPSNVGPHDRTMIIGIDLDESAPGAATRAPCSIWPGERRPLADSGPSGAASPLPFPDGDVRKAGTTSPGVGFPTQPRRDISHKSPSAAFSRKSLGVADVAAHHGGALVLPIGSCASVEARKSWASALNRYRSAHT